MSIERNAERTEHILIVDDEPNMRKPLNIDYILELLERVTGGRASGDLRKPPLNER